MLDQVTPEMKKLGEGALPDGGFYPVSFMISSSSSLLSLSSSLSLSLSVIVIIAVFNYQMNQIDIHYLIILIMNISLFCISVAMGA